MTPLSRPAAARWGLFGAYLLVTIVLSHMPRPPLGERVSDTLLHVLEFCGMAVLLLQALGNGLFQRHASRHLAGTAVFCVLYGIADEIHQAFIPNRFASVKDAVVDATAALVTVGLFALFGLAARRRLHGGGEVPARAGGTPREPARGAGPRSMGAAAERMQERSGGEPPRVELLTREGCHLCEDAREVLAAVMGRRGEGFDIVDVDANAPLAARYGEEVPVVLVDGIKRFKGRVDPGRLERLLSDHARLRRGTSVSIAEDPAGHA